MKAISVFVIIALLASCRKDFKSIPGSLFHKGSVDTATVLQFTTRSISYHFSQDSITTNESVQNGLDQIEIDTHKPIGQEGIISTFKIIITGNSQIVPGTYTFNKNDVLHSAWLSETRGDEVILEYDFSLQVTSYQNGYLDATFHSSRISNGIINNLKVTQ